MWDCVCPLVGSVIEHLRSQSGRVYAMGTVCVIGISWLAPHRYKIAKVIGTERASGGSQCLVNQLIKQKKRLRPWRAQPFVFLSFSCRASFSSLSFYLARPGGLNKCPPDLSFQFGFDRQHGVRTSIRSLELLHNRNRSHFR